MKQRVPSRTKTQRLQVRQYGTTVRVLHGVVRTELKLVGVWVVQLPFCYCYNHHVKLGREYSDGLAFISMFVRRPSSLDPLLLYSCGDAASWSIWESAMASNRHQYMRPRASSICSTDFSPVSEIARYSKMIPKMVIMQ